MSKYVGIIAGAALLAAVAIITFDPAIPFALTAGGMQFFVTTGAGLIIGGIGTLLSSKGQLSGTNGAIRNPVSPWIVSYGRTRVGGTIIYFNSFGQDRKYLDMVIVLACHECSSVDALLFDNVRVLIDENGDSFSPSTTRVAISSLTRANGVVTLVTSSPLAYTDDGDSVEISGVTSDRSLNGKFSVEKLDPSTFRYLNGGFDSTVTGQGHALAIFGDYARKVHMEVLLGNQIETFPGMIDGTPFDGDSSDLVQDTDNPWTATHVLYGRTAVFLRLHYNDTIFSNGLPQISFRMHGKSDIYDPRESVVLQRPTLLLNGWGPNEHEAAYEMGVDQGFGWGLNDDTTYTYFDPGSATDADQNLFSEGRYKHTHKYAGVVWTFAALSATPTNLYLNVLSEVPMGPGGLRSAGIWYSLDAGVTWTEVYNIAARSKHWDNIHLSSSQDASDVQVMAFLDAHDDMWHRVYDIHLSEGPATSGYTENAVLVAADYLSNAKWGFRAAYGTEIPLPELIAGANICDEEVTLARGGTEPRYTANGQFPLSMKRGEIMQNLLTACGGRLTYVAGQFVVHPAAWPGTSLVIGSKPIASAVVYIKSANIDNSTGSTAYSNLTVGPTAAGSGWHAILYLNGPYSARTDSTSLTTGEIAQLEDGSLGVWCRNFQTLFTDLSDPIKVLIYDCWIVVTHPDGSATTYRPTEQHIDVPAPSLGYLENEENAIDIDAFTYATINRLAYRPLADLNACSLVLEGFAPAGGTDGPPDTSVEGVAGSRDVLAITAGAFTWKSKVSARDLFNGVKGTYISPVNDWQSSDMPPYAQDTNHGYASDANLIEDGNERRWLDAQFPFTISSSMAQRLAKIELLRRRQQGMGTFAFNLSMYQTSVLDVVQLTLPILGWSNKLLEVQAHRFTINQQGSGDVATTLLGTELDLQETDPSVYAWNASDELTPQGFQGAVMPSTRTVLPPDDVAAVSGSGTSVVGADGIARSRILVSWTPPADGYVLNGGHMEVQYQKVGDTGWTGLPTVDPSVTQVYIDSVVDGETYNVGVRSVNAAGVPGDWVLAPPVTVSGTASVIPPTSIDSGGADPGDVLVWDGSGWVPTAPTGGGGTLVREVPTGTMNGANTAFTLSFAPVASSLLVFLNGVEQIVITDYTIGGTTLTYVVAPKSTDWHFVYYTH